MKKRVSIKDIAKQLNISITTVSFVINGKAREKNISESLTKKVLELVAELNYQPNTLATSLRTGKTKIIGFLVDDISEPFFSGIARRIDEIASSLGYKILFSSTRNDTEKAIELLQIFKDRHVDGYIMALPEGLEEEVKKLIQTDAPVVLFDRYVQDVKTDYVIIDNLSSTYEATEHLIKNNYKRIGFVTIDTLQQQMVDRLAGYESAVEKYNLPAIVKKIKYVNSAESIEEMIKFFKAEKQLDAVVFAANYICLDGLRTFRKLGIQIHKDMAVVSFDDFEILEFCEPPVTAIAQPLEAIAENVMKILLNKLKKVGKPVENMQVSLPTILNVRGSSAKQ
ncbi:LacI family DNA-binding transcriptional regulator [Pedobacter sp. ISL-68]|uniref:LacI family DNA-binding transcriptional regulator n=1 Tax=unclassified Pedobacter TaxID=2628915 RepID=UPI001BE62E83|nr:MULTISPECIES: LacI family DNA-binding transcriptional regulator [unclassified Pedobacter]MBT2562330.1 LacI family DNA-binding transcriptional regulator [Pedobacter sp. ISL-64]MBT2588899.1 LacI family DNA-binding transcriptional regulator [Pedobacter sp. ISL-68]